MELRPPPSPLAEGSRSATRTGCGRRGDRRPAAGRTSSRAAARSSRHGVAGDVPTPCSPTTPCRRGAARAAPGHRDPARLIPGARPAGHHARADRLAPTGTRRRITADAALLPHRPRS
ncbi:hypothetical protein HBB16_14550 [Pseudonocardia sp. MCCB 268]|nr:hypothetical protein [Pseudonocardia cytotoxica]